jgi:hypothetical protein
LRITIKVVVPEWLSGMTRNHVGFARAGSNPADHVFASFYPFFFLAMPSPLIVVMAFWAEPDL